MPGKAKFDSPVVFTANRLRDGSVVWLAADARWVERVVDAAPFPSDTAPDGIAAARAAEAAQHVVGAYATEVRITPEGPVPLRLRERIRADGPTVVAPADQPAAA